MWNALVLAILLVLPVDDVLARIGALEAQNTGLRSRVSELETSAVRANRQRSQADLTGLVSRLDPGALTHVASYRGGDSRLPALAQPLLARLKDDASMGGMVAGRVDPTASFGNVLPDPVFETLPTAYTLTAVSSLISDANPQWETWWANYVLNSGTAPATVKTIGKGFPRWINGRGYGSLTDQVSSSGWGILTLQWGAAAGDLTVYLTSSSTDPAVLSSLIESWITAGVDVMVPGAYSNVTSATAYVEIINAAETLEAQSDPVDLLALNTADLRGTLQTALDGPSNLDEYRWRLRIDVVYPASAGTIEIAFTQPQLAWSEDGSVPQFTPAVGRWVPEVARFHGARAYRTATQSINNNSDTAILFDTGNAAESWDTDNFHSLSSSAAQFAAPFTGYYHFDGGAVFAGNATGIRSLWFELNADGVQRALVRELGPIAGSAASLVTSFDAYLTTGQYVRLMVNQTSGGALNVLASDRNTFLDVHLVGV